ncbi:hypothetical protein SAMN05660330_00865 [Desulforhopalus singaporensis]|uniref:AMP-binding enzyme C-terminal domain-containing protein n=1 Tax=Desulforhopalus singaporensis TaxID=91360 RepID=A0A1H0LUR8_9BACT|nr:hypothetical protein SAMN05660330_00865 [Desulforhopalus singaporensis]
MAFVIVKDDLKGSVAEGEIRDFIGQFVNNGTIPKYGVPERIMLVDAISKTSVGKINKRVLRKLPPIMFKTPSTIPASLLFSASKRVERDFLLCSLSIGCCSIICFPFVTLFLAPC